MLNQVLLNSKKALLTLLRGGQTSLDWHLGWTITNWIVIKRINTLFLFVFLPEERSKEEKDQIYQQQSQILSPESPLQSEEDCKNYKWALLQDTSNWDFGVFWLPRCDFRMDRGSEGVDANPPLMYLCASKRGINIDEIINM